MGNNASKYLTSVFENDYAAADTDCEPMDSSTLLQRIPIELWNRILSEDQGFTVEDFRSLCFVAPFFRTICQPLAYRSLSARRVKVSYGYCFEYADSRGKAFTQTDRWKRDMMDLIRAERRLYFFAGDASLSTFPRTMCIGDKVPQSDFALPADLADLAISIEDTLAESVPATSEQAPHAHPPADCMPLSQAVYDAYLQFKCTLVQTLASFTQLCGERTDSERRIGPLTYYFSVRLADPIALSGP